MTVDAALLSAIAEVLRALAWPGIALLAVLRFQPEIRRLIDRLRKGGGAEFDPLPRAQESVAVTLATTASGTLSTLPLPRTPATIAFEHTIQSFAPLKNATSPADREAILTTLAARGFLIFSFEKVEGVIWASQVELLNYLNSRPAGETAARLKELFFEPAMARFPDAFQHYGFEGYLGFLAQSMLVGVQDLHVTITMQGTEYLAWRVEQHKLPKLSG